MDPYAVLGVRPGAPETEIAAAYREAAKRWHPDRAGEAGQERMAEINAAYDLVRAAAQHGAAPRRPTATRGPGGRGDWLIPPLRLPPRPGLLGIAHPGGGGGPVYPVV